MRAAGRILRSVEVLIVDVEVGLLGSIARSLVSCEGSLLWLLLCAEVLFPYNSLALQIVQSLIETLHLSSFRFQINSTIELHQNCRTGNFRQTMHYKTTSTIL